MSQELLIAGAGIGGLAAAVAARDAGWEVRLLEQSALLEETGAGIQLGPNATHVLKHWGIDRDGLTAAAAQPSCLRVRDARTGRERGVLQLGRVFEARYGAPYLTVHRADLHRCLQVAAQARDVRLHRDTRVTAWRQEPSIVFARAGNAEIEADALVGADGLWSSVRAQLIVNDGPPRSTGHLAYRTLVRQADLPQVLRSMEVTAWLGPRMHVVTYPVRGGEWLNVVCLVEGEVTGDARDWDHPALASQLRTLLPPICTNLRELIDAVGQWRLWALHDREPLRGPGQMAAGLVALLGDAAHPMLPYLAQGAGMAIEDARELQRVLAAVADRAMDVPTAMRRYALNRWQRCARVQRRSLANAKIFHASGLVGFGRDISMRLLGESVMDMPWLYGHRA